MARTILLLLLAAFTLPHSSRAEEVLPLPYKVSLAAFDPLQPRVFLVPNGSNSLEVMNVQTLASIGHFDFPHSPVSLAITPNGQHLYVAVTKRPSGQTNAGQVVEFDLSSMSQKKITEIPFDPADIVATDNGILIISGAAGALTEVATFSAETGAKLGSAPAKPGVQLALHPSQSIVYGADTQGERGLHHFALDPNGSIGSHWSASGGNIGRDVFLSPDGRRVINGQSGGLYTTSTNQTNDLQWLGGGVGLAPVLSAAADTNRNLMLLISPQAYAAYEYTTDRLIFIRFSAGAESIGLQGGKVTAIYASQSGLSEIRRFAPPALTLAENLPPTIFLDPVDPSPVLPVGTPLSLHVQGKDEDGYVQLLYLRNQNGTIATRSGGNNESFYFGTVIQPGSNEFYVVGYDNFNVGATSRVVQVYGNTPPTVQLLDPTSNLTLYSISNSMTIRGTATDAEGIREVHLVENGRVIATDFSAPYEFLYKPTNYGTFTLVLRAVDNLGSTSVSQSRTLQYVRVVDNLERGIPVQSTTNLVLRSSNVDATLQKGEPRHADVAGGKSVWFAWRAPAMGTVQIDTYGSDFDTILAVYTNRTSEIPVMTNIFAIASNDDDSEVSPLSRVKFSTLANQTYYIAVDGRDGTAGNIVLNIRLSSSRATANDFLVNAVRITVPGTTQGRNTFATKESGEPDHAGNRGGASLWFRIDGVFAGQQLELSTSGSNFDTLLAVYTNAIQQNQQPPTMETLRLVASNDDAPGSSNRTSKVTITPPTSGTYWVAVDGYEGAEGNVLLTYTRTISQAVIPPNDFFAKSTVLSGGSVLTNVNTLRATSEPGEPIVLSFPHLFGKTVWYRWTAPADGPVYLTTKWSNFDTVMGVYSGTTIQSLTQVALNDDGPAGGQTSALVFNAVAGREYRILIGGYMGAAGDLVLALNQSRLTAPRLITQFQQGRLSIQVEEGEGAMILEASTNLIDWEVVRSVDDSRQAFQIEPDPSEPLRFYRMRLAE